MTKNKKANHHHIEWQPEFCPDIPTAYGPIEYRTYRQRLIEIDRLLLAGIETQFVREVCAPLPEDCPAKQLQRMAKNAALALRSNIARKLHGLGYSAFATRAADSNLLRWFLRIDALGMKRTPAKSTLERNDKIFSPERMDAFNLRVFAQSAQEHGARELGLHAPVEFSDMFIDATCLKANIHFPIDWVLLRDAARTLMKAVACIRRHGLRNRMPQDPLRFLGEMNKLSMAMSASARKTGTPARRKRILRLMKKLSGKIEAHARAHLALLAQQRERAGLSEKQAAQIAGRIERILAQLPAAIKQAHERIIGGRKIKNSEKILSLYEEDANVIIRGKAGARVEFGRELLLCETRNGMIAHHTLLAPGQDANEAFRKSLETLESAGLKPQVAWADRGLGIKANKKYLEQKEIKSGLCERNPEELRERLENEEGYAEGLKRRGATEARIAIVKNIFVGNPCLAKGEEHTRVALGWAVLAHNLWVLARQEINKREEKKKMKEQKDKKRKRKKTT